MGWHEQAKHALYWHVTSAKQISSTPEKPNYFQGWQTNLTYNILEKQKASHVALKWRDNKYLTVSKLASKVARFANYLHDDVKLSKGNVMLIHLPYCEELIVSMLAASRIGVIFTLANVNLSEQELEDRIQSCHAKLIVTIDSYNAQRPVEVVQNVRNKCHSIQQIVCVFRKEPTSLVFDQCASFAKVSKNGAKECPMVWMQAQDPLLILFHNKLPYVYNFGFLVHGVIDFTKIQPKMDNSCVWVAVDTPWMMENPLILLSALSQGHTVLLESNSNQLSGYEISQVLQSQNVTCLFMDIKLVHRLQSSQGEKSKCHSIAILGDALHECDDTLLWAQSNMALYPNSVFDILWTESSGGFVQLASANTCKLLQGCQVVDEFHSPSDIGQLSFQKAWPSQPVTIYNNHQAYRNSFNKGMFITGDMVITSNKKVLLATPRNILKSSNNDMASSSSNEMSLTAGAILATAKLKANAFYDLLGMRLRNISNIAGDMQKCSFNADIPNYLLKNVHFEFVHDVRLGLVYYISASLDSMQDMYPELKMLNAFLSVQNAKFVASNYAIIDSIARPAVYFEGSMTLKDSLFGILSVINLDNKVINVKCIGNGYPFISDNIDFSSVQVVGQIQGTIIKFSDKFRFEDPTLMISISSSDDVPNQYMLGLAIGCTMKFTFPKSNTESALVCSLGCDQIVVSNVTVTSGPKHIFGSAVFKDVGDLFKIDGINLRVNTIGVQFTLLSDYSLALMAEIELHENIVVIGAIGSNTIAAFVQLEKLDLAYIIKAFEKLVGVASPHDLPFDLIFTNAMLSIATSSTIAFGIPIQEGFMFSANVDIPQLNFSMQNFVVQFNKSAIAMSGHINTTLSIDVGSVSIVTITDPSFVINIPRSSSQPSVTQYYISCGLDISILHVKFDSVTFEYIKVSDEVSKLVTATIKDASLSSVLPFLSGSFADLHIDELSIAIADHALPKSSSKVKQVPVSVSKGLQVYGSLTSVPTGTQMQNVKTMNNNSDPSSLTFYAALGAQKQISLITNSKFSLGSSLQCGNFSIVVTFAPEFAFGVQFDIIFKQVTGTIKLDMNEIEAIGSVTLKRDDGDYIWKNVILDGINLGPVLILSVELNYEQFAATGIPSGLGVAGQIAIDDVKIDMAVNISEDPQRELLYGAINELTLSMLFKIGSKLFGLPIDVPMPNIFEFYDLEVYFAASDMYLGTVFYQQGFRIRGVFQILGVKGFVNIHADSSGIHIEGALKEINLFNVLKITHANGAMVDWSKFETMAGSPSTSQTKDAQRIEQAKRSILDDIKKSPGPSALIDTKQRIVQIQGRISLFGAIDESVMLSIEGTKASLDFDMNLLSLLKVHFHGEADVSKLDFIVSATIENNFIDFIKNAIHEALQTISKYVDKITSSISSGTDYLNDQISSFENGASNAAEFDKRRAQVRQQYDQKRSDMQKQNDDDDAKLKTFSESVAAVTQSFGKLCVCAEQDFAKLATSFDQQVQDISNAIQQYTSMVQQSIVAIADLHSATRKQFMDICNAKNAKLPEIKQSIDQLQLNVDKQKASVTSNYELMNKNPGNALVKKVYLTSVALYNNTVKQLELEKQLYMQLVGILNQGITDADLDQSITGLNQIKATLAEFTKITDALAQIRAAAQKAQEDSKNLATARQDMNQVLTEFQQYVTAMSQVHAQSIATMNALEAAELKNIDLEQEAASSGILGFFCDIAKGVLSAVGEIAKGVGAIVNIATKAADWVLQHALDCMIDIKKLEISTHIGSDLAFKFHIEGTAFMIPFNLTFDFNLNDIKSIFSKIIDAIKNLFSSSLHVASPMIMMIGENSIFERISSSDGFERYIKQGDSTKTPYILCYTHVSSSKIYFASLFFPEKYCNGCYTLDDLLKIIEDENGNAIEYDKIAPTVTRYPDEFKVKFLESLLDTANAGLKKKYNQSSGSGTTGRLSPKLSVLIIVKQDMETSINDCIGKMSKYSDKVLVRIRKNLEAFPLIFTYKDIKFVRSHSFAGITVYYEVSKESDLKTLAAASITKVKIDNLKLQFKPTKTTYDDDHWKSMCYHYESVYTTIEKDSVGSMGSLRYPEQRGVMGVSAKDCLMALDNSYKKDAGLWAWLHLSAHSYGKLDNSDSPQQSYNLVVGTVHCNTQMEVVENAIKLCALKLNANVVLCVSRSMIKEPYMFLASQLQYRASIVTPQNNYLNLEAYFNPYSMQESPSAIYYFYQVLASVLQ